MRVFEVECHCKQMCHQPPTCNFRSIYDNNNDMDHYDSMLSRPS